MISTIPFVIGFIIYIGFCLITFETYSKGKEMTKAPILTFIYIYYTALASYTINLVEQGTQNFLIFAQISFYAIPCAFILLFYYKKNIKPRDEEMYGQNV